MWDRPMEEARIDKDCDRDINSTDFVYDKNWKKKNFLFTTKHKHTIELMFNTSESTYILFNRTTQEINRYPTYSNASDVILALSGKKYPKDIALSKVVSVYEVNEPNTKPFLQKDEHGREVFNIFNPSKGLKIMTNQIKIDNYRRPEAILQFLANLIPDVATRTKFLGYLKHKYLTYDYSPLYFVLAGVGGAGKGILVHDILTYLSGMDRVYSVKFEEFANTNFNSYLENTDWLELEEAGEGYSKKEGEKLVAQLKRITGNAYTALTKKGKDSRKIRHYITPIISTNMTTKLITDSIDNDRRLILIKCPHKIINRLPMTLSNGTVIKDTRKLLQTIHIELPMFAKYLATEVEDIPIMDYLDNTNWKNDDYTNFIHDSLSDVDKLYNYACVGDLDEFVEVLLDCGIDALDINNMFSLSNPTEGAYCMVYNTNSSKELGVKSLEDICLSTPILSSNTKMIYRTIKKVLNKRRDFRTYKVNIITFNKPYKVVGDIIDVECESINLKD